MILTCHCLLAGRACGEGGHTAPSLFFPFLDIVLTFENSPRNIGTGRKMRGDDTDPPHEKGTHMNLITARLRGRKGILEVALDVHMTKTGSFERDAAEQEYDVMTLLLALENWQTRTWAGSEQFDAAVFKLLQAAVEEGSWLTRKGRKA